MLGFITKHSRGLKVKLGLNVKWKDDPISRPRGKKNRAKKWREWGGEEWRKGNVKRLSFSLTFSFFLDSKVGANVTTPAAAEVTVRSLVSVTLRNRSGKDTGALFFEELSRSPTTAAHHGNQKSDSVLLTRLLHLQLGLWRGACGLRLLITDHICVTT